MEADTVQKVGHSTLSTLVRVRRVLVKAWPLNIGLVVFNNYPLEPGQNVEIATQNIDIDILEGNIEKDFYTCIIRENDD